MGIFGRAFCLDGQPRAAGAQDRAGGRFPAPAMAVLSSPNVVSDALPPEIRVPTWADALLHLRDDVPARAEDERDPWPGKFRVKANDAAGEQLRAAPREALQQGSANCRSSTCPACDTTPVPSPVTSRPRDHAVAFT